MDTACCMSCWQMPSRTCLARSARRCRAAAPCRVPQPTRGQWCSPSPLSPAGTMPLVSQMPAALWVMLVFAVVTSVTACPAPHVEFRHHRQRHHGCSTVASHVAPVAVGMRSQMAASAGRGRKQQQASHTSCRQHSSCWPWCLGRHALQSMAAALQGCMQLNANMLGINLILACCRAPGHCG